MACLIDDRSSPSLVGSRRGDWQSERLFKTKQKNFIICLMPVDDESSAVVLVELCVFESVTRAR